jgi:hypothetical protein
MRPSSLAVLAAVSASLALPVQADPTPAAVKEGKAAFAAGVNLLQDPDGAKYEEANVQFRRAYELLQNWKVLGNLGLCALKLERDGEAIDAYEKYIAKGGKDIDPDEKAQVERDLATLKAQVATVHLQFVGGAPTRLVDERINARGGKVLNEYKASGPSIDLGLHPGHHIITATLIGGTGHWEVDFMPGSSTSHKLEAAASPPPPTLAGTKSAAGSPDVLTSRPIPTTVFVAGGITGALVIGSAVTGLMALSKRSQFNEINGKPGHTATEVADAHDSAKSMGTINTVLTGAAIAGAGLTVVLLVTRPERRTVTGSSFVAPWVTAQGGGVSIGGEL